MVRMTCSMEIDVFYYSQFWNWENNQKICLIISDWKPLLKEKCAYYLSRYGSEGKSPKKKRSQITTYQLTLRPYRWCTQFTELSIVISYWNYFLWYQKRDLALIHVPAVTNASSQCLVEPSNPHGIEQVARGAPSETEEGQHRGQCDKWVCLSWQSAGEQQDQQFQFWESWENAAALIVHSPFWLRGSRWRWTEFTERWSGWNSVKRCQNIRWWGLVDRENQW